MSEKSSYDSTLVGITAVVPKYHVEDIEKLKKKTSVGSYIKFKANAMNEDGHFAYQDIAGVVEEKYPHIFKMNGRYYNWVDYLIGFIF